MTDTKNYTFTLQGCPAFLSITDYQWFDNYTRELDSFSADIEAYSDNAWKEREGWKTSHETRWAGSRLRKIISSDQDLISHLIHTYKIIQDDPKVFCGQSNLYYAENPLYIHSHALLQLRKTERLKFTIAGDSCFIEDRKIAIWHFQSNFVRYINHFLLLQRMFYPFSIPNELETSSMVTSMLKRVSRRRYLGRLQIYEALKELNRSSQDAELSFKDIFNRKRFWKKDILS